MGKMIAALWIVFVIEISLTIFQMPTLTNTALVTFLKGPSATTLSELSFFSIFNERIGALLIAGAVFVGALFVLRPEIVPAGVALTLFTFIYSIISLWQAINSQAIFTDAGSSGLIATIITAPLLLYYIIVVFDYFRKPD